MNDDEQYIVLTTRYFQLSDVTTDEFTENIYGIDISRFNNFVLIWSWDFVLIWSWDMYRNATSDPSISEGQLNRKAEVKWWKNWHWLKTNVAGQDFQQLWLFPASTKPFPWLGFVLSDVENHICGVENYYNATFIFIAWRTLEVGNVHASK